MVDGMHAVVFVDNHDNQVIIITIIIIIKITSITIMMMLMMQQRGHGGGGGVLTASNQIQGNPAFHNDWQYKVITNNKK